MFRRICLFVFGLLVMSFGVAFSIKSTFGTTPISSISYSLALCTGIDIGITTVIFNAALVFIQMIVLRIKKLSLKFPGGPLVKTLCFYCREYKLDWGTKIPN